MSVHDITQTDRRHFVYWLFDADGRCLYVGMTRQPEKRWRQHKYQKREMVARVASKRMAGPFLLETARRLEREQQDELQPVYDVRTRQKRSNASFREAAQLAARAAKRRQAA